MSGVWIFDKKGVARLIKNPTRESFEQKEPPLEGTATAPGARPRVLVYLPTNQVVRSYSELEQQLTELGWTRYIVNNQGHGVKGSSSSRINNSSTNNRNNNEDVIQFHKSDESTHLITLPWDFANFKAFHMYDIVVKNPSFFQVRDARFTP